jgi:hypothetical protein
MGVFEREGFVDLGCGGAANRRRFGASGSCGEFRVMGGGMLMAFPPHLSSHLGAEVEGGRAVSCQSCWTATWGGQNT